MKNFVHTEEKTYKNEYDEPYHVTYEYHFNSYSVEQKYHIDMSSYKGYTVSTHICLSVEDARELRDDIDKFLKDKMPR